MFDLSMYIYIICVGQDFIFGFYQDWQCNCDCGVNVFVVGNVYCVVMQFGQGVNQGQVQFGIMVFDIVCIFGLVIGLVEVCGFFRVQIDIVVIDGQYEIVVQ